MGAAVVALTAFSGQTESKERRERPPLLSTGFGKSLVKDRSMRGGGDTRQSEE